MRLRPARAALATALIAVLAGCGLPVMPWAGEGPHPSRMASVAADEDATADDVADAGRAVDAAYAGDVVLVSYSVDQGTSEGRSAAAWRLYDAAGDPVAAQLAGVTDEGAAYAEVSPVPDGFVVVDQAAAGEDPAVWHVAPDGTRRRLGRPEPVGLAAGDVAVGREVGRVYRPSTGLLVGPRPSSRDTTQGRALDPAGTLWGQGTGRGSAGRVGTVPFARSVRGAPWEDVAGVRTTGSEYVASGTLTAVGDRVVALLLTEWTPADEARLRALLVRRGDAPAGRAWTRVSGPWTEDDWWDPEVAPLGDDRMLLVGRDRAYVVDLDAPEASGWEELAPPTDEDGWRYRTDGGRVLAFHADFADGRVSGDGRRWERLPH